MLVRCTTAVTTWIVAMVVALAVPVSQLRTVSVIQTCCCPDPARCHCPDHKPDRSTHPTIKACHQEREVVVSASTLAFTLPDVETLAPSRPLIALVDRALSQPHPQPILERPAAPS